MAAAERFSEEHVNSRAIDVARAERLEASVLACWMLKDAGWVLLCWPLAFGGALGAVAAELRFIGALWLRQGPMERAQVLAELAWLCGNAVWMMVELLYMPSPEPGRMFPWHRGPVLEAREGAYDAGVVLARAILGLGLVGLLLFYAYYACRGTRSSPRPAGSHSFGQESSSYLLFGLVTREAYCSMYIGPWIFKDLCWSMDLLWPTIAGALVVMFLVMDYARRFGGLIYVAEFLWVASNSVWAVAELGLEDKYILPRLIAGVMNLVGMTCVCRVLWQQPPSAVRSPTEGTPLAKAF